jgi:aspartate racemase
MKTVGIIGGLGPETTSEFYLNLVLSCQKLDKTCRPPIIISNVPLPYKIEEEAISKNKNLEKCLPFLQSEARRLEKAGADFIVLPCNSLHVFIEDIRETVEIKVFSIIEETVKFLNLNKLEKVGIISTTATVENRLYESAFAENEIGYIAPDPLEQAKLGKIIYNLVSGVHINSDRQELISTINTFQEKMVDCALLACTDLQLLLPDHPEVPIFDTMKILADSTVNHLLEKSEWACQSRY